MDFLSRNGEDLERFPKVLQKLVEDEIEAGNQIVEFGHGFPAAPCGAYIKLARPVSTRERVATNEVNFYDRNMPTYSGEFTDSTRHFFVLEPPHPEEAPPDMEAIRAALDPSYNVKRMVSAIAESPDKPIDDAAVMAFIKSMEMTFDKWKEGEGYDLKLIETANESTRREIESILVRHSPRDWRDIEALALIDSPRTHQAIQNAFLSEDTKVRMAVHRYSPQLINERQRIDSIVQSLCESEIFSGLSETLTEIEDFHPPEIIQALMFGLLSREGSIACHFAAMLYYLHGKANSAFDWAHRPFFLRFNTEDLEKRKEAIRELCESIGCDPAEHGC